MVRVAMLMCEHHYKLVYNTSSAPLYPAASLSGAAASTQQRSAPRLETSTAQLTSLTSIENLVGEQVRIFKQVLSH
eukprot:COSAG02_NODE_1114_length_14502_cov_140.830035_11_plen_76_part_00